MVFKNPIPLPDHSNLIREWLLRQREHILWESPRNPFAAELAVHSIENWYYSLFISAKWQDQPLNEFRSYSRWRSGRLREWKSVADQRKNVWAVPETSREEFTAELRSDIEESFTEYRNSETWPSHAPPMLCQSFEQFLQQWVKNHCDIGRLFSIFGGVLAVEWQIQLVEDVVKTSLEGIQEPLLWRYGIADFALDMYLEGNSKTDTECAFLEHWRSYIAAVGS